MIHHGDCLDVMASMEPESVDAIVTDPPYGLEFMGKEWDRLWATRKPSDPAKMAAVTARTGRHAGHSDPFLSARVQRYKAGPEAQAFHARWAEAAYRVAKPSAYLLAFGGTRTVHRMTVALEDAGWIIRDMLVWAYASGFPKSKASLKPAWEPIIMARKPGPLRMLAIDACRIPTDDRFGGGAHAVSIYGSDGHYEPGPNAFVASEKGGRWPANVILTDPIFDGGVEGVVGGGEAVGAQSNSRTPGRNQVLGRQNGMELTEGYGDSGTYSRFFILPKADRSDREPVVRIGSGGSVAGASNTARNPSAVDSPVRTNSHPTVKPTELMRHLVRLVTPSGGTVLDPFLGSGTTGLACELEGFPWIGIEKEAEYVAIAEARLNGTQRGLGLSA